MTDKIIYPPFLKKGDRIAIVSPSGAVDPSFIDGACETLRLWGLSPEVAPHAKGSFGRFSGTDQQRLSDLQNAMDDPSISAILCGRGGYGAVRILDKINFEKFICHPKWLIGFSDITAIHSSILLHGVASIHGVMAKALAHGEENYMAVDSLKKILFEGLPSYEIETSRYNRTGETEGILAGGNLSLIYALRGTKFDVNPQGKILFIEDLSERLYHIDRMMQNLRLGGVLENISGLVVGRFTDIAPDDTFNQTLEEIILSAVSDYDYPVLFGFPVGHVARNMPLIHGGKVHLSVTSDKSSLTFK